MHIAVGVISPNAAWVLPRRFVDELRAEFPQHTITAAWDRQALRAALLDADAAFAAFLDADLVPSLSKLRWVQAPAAGVGHIISPELIASQIVLTSARGIRARAIAEHVLGVTLVLARQIHTAIRRQVNHVWALDELESSGAIRTLHGARMGIVGLGSIGAEIAALVGPFGMRVSGIRKRIDRPLPPGVEDVLPPEQLPLLLARSDVVVLSAPLTEETRFLIGAETIGCLKPGALLINIGRGKLVDDHAVIAALQDGRLGGAALDVFTTEPLEPASPYWDLPNVVITPHTSGAMEDYWSPLVRLFAGNLRRFDAGAPLVNVVDKEAGY
jgi:phosphoglycerate dehydrogenase-like enzyme